jgi:hypothetical protein
MAGLHLSEPSNPLDVTHESSKIVKLAFSDFFTSKRKCKPEGFHAVCVHNISLLLVACLLNKGQRASSARCLQNKARGLTTPRSSKPPSPDIVDVTAPEIEVNQRCALPQHSHYRPDCNSD